MSAGQLLADLGRLGIRLEVEGDRLRFTPRSAVTPDLIERLKVHKSELLTILYGNAPKTESPDISEEWEAARSADDSDPEALDPDGWPTDSIDPYELDPCSQCGMLELWQTAAGNWRCEHCDPPVKAQHLAKLVERIRRRTARKNSTGLHNQYRVG